MAEARSAVSYRVEKTNLLLQVSDDEIVLRINRNLLPITWKKLRSAAYKSAVKLRNSLFNAFYPAPPYHWAITISGSVYSMIYKPTSGLSHFLWGFDRYIPSAQSVSPTLRATIISAAVSTGAIFVMSYVRKFILRALLGYQGWLYDNPRSQSKRTIIWGILVKLVSGQHNLRLSRQKPLLYSNQGGLPRLPVPSLEQTCSKYLQSVAPLLSPEDFSQMQKLVASFKKNEGRRLQRYLVLKSWLTSNYVSDWWLNYVYLRGRSPIIINSNYYVLDCGLPNPPTTQPVARAARLIYNFVEFKYLVDREVLPPQVIRDTVPMCMSQYERIFSTVRYPGKEMDVLEHFDYDSNHIIVFRKGYYYSIDMYDDYGRPLSVGEIENQLKWIVRDADKNTLSPAEANVAALTSENRTIWANAKEEFFSFGLNKASLDAIDKAMFVVVLEEGNPEDYPIGNHSIMARSLFHGNGGNRWVDKSFNLIIFPNGKAGLNTEHSWADAPVMAHAWEYSIFANGAHDPSTYDSDGFNKRTKCRARPPPVRLRWDFSAKAEKVILTALDNCRALINDINLEVITHLSYGKGFIKKCKVSPDAYVQIAMQLAYRRDTGKFDLTYESSMTRLFKLGRTETVRPVTLKSREFVEAMLNPNMSKKEKIKLLVDAGEVHQQSYRDCMTGKGIDRHLFALYVVSQGINVKSEFLNNALSMKWKLSTSQQPQNQTDFWDSTKNPELISPGGGFGPVADDGYGVSYMIAGEDRLFFHISSKKSSPCDSKRFGEKIVEALKEMKELFE